MNEFPFHDEHDKLSEQLLRELDLLFPEAAPRLA